MYIYMHQHACTGDNKRVRFILSYRFVQSHQ